MARDRKLRLDRVLRVELVAQPDRPRGKRPDRLDPKDQPGVLWQRGADAT